MGSVYIIVNNINNKAYIGATKQKLEYRTAQHKYNANCKTISTPLYIDIRKYGWENFSVIGLFESDNIDELREAEKFYISQYDDLYNQTKGGELHNINSKCQDKFVIRVRDNEQDRAINKFIEQYSSTKGISKSATIRTLLEYGITLALQELYEDQD